MTGPVGAGHRPHRTDALEPTPVQSRLLLRIHQAAGEAQRMLERVREHGDRSGDVGSAGWWRAVDAANTHVHTLGGLATAGGVPYGWIARAQRLGSSGRHWEPGGWPEPAPVDRDHLIGEVMADARTVLDATAVHTTIGFRAEPATTPALRRTDLIRAWIRVGALAQMLDIPAGHDDWPQPTRAWAGPHARALAEIEPELLAIRARALATTLRPDVLGQQVDVLEGIGIVVQVSEHPLPPVPIIAARVDAALRLDARPTPGSNLVGGAAIDEAIDAACPESTVTLAAGPDPPLAVTALSPSPDLGM